MMLTVKMMKPFYTLQEGHELKLVFAYQYFSVMKGEEIYHFIPVESNEIRINLKTKQVENLTDIFVFQRGTRIFRIPLFQLLQVSDLIEHLRSISQFYVDQIQADEEEQAMNDEIMNLEMQNLYRLIDKALLEGDRDLFMQLTNQLKTEEAAQ
ncbi:IDEAL domain-containing protein [Jeotgalibacillus haloalkalitolerans]|uniref:IDEAL domain-containing protein n=1 Tax=Jeotgalibacillus haloalkalitolerans TaxID=3104292 RepID=A0ABU5KJ92_9BACL|nr:IDEAL domain-containing protein [Jeotgalibacillus sp. HH7-29]MDZ5711288.1 IDEAL domain-containing protein [Jeotgalibacillus sp. HH7-29]